MPDKDPDARRAALALLRRGLITVPEAAQMAGVSRQLVRHWCQRSGIDWAQIRSAALAKRWRREVAKRR